ncbi:MAG: Gfo/Idh/MocA family oxidoreductase [Pirellulaceae bacterium]|nr:Gfo/Idh/MocA family oxidoreductase [Pirellulaceae bacterium]
MSDRTRRQFLEDSMLAAAAAAVAASAGQSLVLAEEETQSKSPNEKLGVAVVGVKGRGGSHIGAFAGRNDTEILYICDVDREIGQQRATEVGKRQGGRVPQFEEDLRKVLEDDRVDIVSIATPNHWHALGAIWAIQAGKDVYVEKPVSHNVSEGRRIVEAARKYNRICQTGTQSRSNPGMISSIQYLHDGKLGDVRVARGLCYKRRGEIGPRGEYAVPSSVNYDLWLGPAPMAPVTRKQFHYDWHWQWPYGNGDLGNQGIHQMDIARWGLGEPGLGQAVLSYGGRYGYTDAGDTANTQVVIHDYGDKSLVFEVRGLATDDYKSAKVGVIFEGTEGYLVIPNYYSGVVFDRDGRKVQEISQPGNDANHFANFLKAVRSRKVADLTGDIEEGHVSSALCHLGNISYLLGQQMSLAEALPRLREFHSTDNNVETLERTIQHLKDNKVSLDEAKLGMGLALRVDTATETIVGNDAANAMLTREYRKPFVVPSAGQV